jgi:hypothetical protein
MADKSFGVKELNLLGSSGTPSIESPNDLNLNANTVAISTNLTVGSKLSVTSAGIVTAVSGVVTYFGDGSFLSGIEGGVGANGSVNTTGIITASSFSGIWSGSVIKEEFGGTNQSTYTKGDILYASNTNTLSKLAAGSDTNILTLTSGVPAWEPAGTSGVPGINTEGTSTFENVVINGNAGIGSLNVTGVSTFGSHLVVQAAGVATFYNNLASDYSTHGSVVMHGGLGVSQMSNFGDGLNVIGHTEVDTLNVSGVVTAASANFTGNVSIGGTLTYEDVTNVDSVGVVTAQKGIRIGAGYSIGSTDPASEDIKYYGDGQYLDNIFTTGGGGQGEATINAGVFSGTGLLISGVSTFSSLTANRVVTVGAGGSLVDNSLLGFDGVALTVTGNLFLPNAGNHMGIGTASKLGPGTDALSVWESSEDSGVRIWASSALHHATSVPLQVANYQGTEYFRVNGNGNVGIATTNPVRNLHIHEPSPVGNAYLHMTTDATGGTTEDGFSLYVQPDGSTWYRARELTGRHIWTTENTETMRLTADANLGIGTDDPTASNINSALGVNTSVLAVGVVTARTFYGDGTHLTGTGGGTLISGITVQDDGGAVGTAGSIRILDFQGALNATISGTDTALITSDGWIQDSQGNLYAGGDAGAASDADTTFNIAIGCNAGKVLNEGDRNVFLGCSSGQSVTSGFDHVMIGRAAGLGVTDGQSNIFLGMYVAKCATTGSYNTFLGADAGKCHNGSCNLFIGNNAGVGSATDILTNNGTNNIAIGYKAGCCLTSGNVNILIGQSAGDALTATCGAVAIGCDALTTEDTNGAGAIAIGREALKIQNASTVIGGTVGKNIAIGEQAGSTLVDATENIFLGYQAGQGVLGSKNIAIGSKTLQASNSGQLNVAIGLDAAKSNAGSFNVVMGGNAAAGGAGDGSENVIIGNGAGSVISDGDKNVFLGADAGNSVTTGCCNVVIGHGADVASATANTQFLIGIGATNWIKGDSNFNLYDKNGNAITGGAASGPDAQENFYVGTNAGQASDTDTCYNIGIGYSAAYSLNSGDNNVMIGKQAGACLTSGQYNTFLGCHAGYNNNGCCNFFAVNGAGCGNETGLDNVFIGYNAGQGTNASTKDASHNIAIGRYSGGCLDGGDYNVFLGSLAGYCTYLNAGCNINIGWCAGLGNRTGIKNIVMGCKAASGSSNIVRDGSCNLILGSEAGCMLSTGNGNVFLGHCAGIAITTGGYNVGVGYSVGACLWGGYHNILLGNQVGKNLTSGSCNVVIGNWVEVPSATGNRQLFIGNNNDSWIAGDSSYNVTLAGIATVYAATGIVSATSFYGDGSHLLGLGGETLISGITVQEQGVNVGTGGSITTINFIGDSITATTGAGSSEVNVTVTAGSLWLSNDTGIHTTARVGIGTTTATPAMLNLHADSSNNDLIVFSAAGAASTERITLASSTNDNGTISFEGSEGSLFSVTNNLSSGSIFSVNDISGIPSIDVDADGTIQLAPLASGSGGKVGIGTTNPSTRLHVEGNVKVTGVVTATDFDSTSDIRLKTNIKLINDPLAKVVQIEGVSFNWKQDNRPALGVIADQIEKVIPELVHGDDPKTVNYNGLVGLLIEVVKDQQTQIDDLNKRLSKLE